LTNNEVNVLQKICVIGSFNIDVTASMNRFPKTGETVICDSFEILVGGGKGANQAVALGKLGADVPMVGKLGDAFYGPEYIEVLKQNNVKCSMVGMEQNMIPGSAIVAVDGNGDNLLMIYPGANARVSIDFIQSNWDGIIACDIVLLQLEIPDETNRYLAKMLHAAGKTIIFDPAPAKEAAFTMFPYVDYVTPNETELESYTGIAAACAEDFHRAGRMLLDRGAKTVIAKAGKTGAYLITPTDFEYIPCPKVRAIDPTAAGDCFNAGVAFGLASGWDIHKSIEFAHAVAGISTTALGAQSAMPSYLEVVEFLKTHKTND
jgi:ribokinase